MDRPAFKKEKPRQTRPRRVGLHNQRHHIPLWKILVQQRKVFRRQLQTVPRVASIIAHNLRRTRLQPPDRLTPVHQVVGRQQERRTLRVLTSHQLVAHLAARTQQKSAHLRPTTRHRAESLHHLQNHSINNIELQLDRNRFFRRLPGVAGDYRDGIQSSVQVSQLLTGLFKYSQGSVWSLVFDCNADRQPGRYDYPRHSAVARSRRHRL